VRIRLKLAILFTAATLVLLAGAGLVFLTTLHSGLQNSIDNSLRSRVDEAVSQYYGESDSQPPPSLTFANNSYGQVLSTAGVVLAHTDDALTEPLLTPDQAQAAASHEHFSDQLASITGRGSGAPTTRTEIRVLAAPSGHPGTVVAVATTRDVADEALERAAKQLLVLGAAVLLVAGPGSWLLARGALRPVDRMRAQAAELGARDAGAGLTVPDTRDEIARLAETLNGLLGRLHQAYQRERAFVADAGHELRTPLTVLRGELELAQRAGRTRAELAETVEVAAAETDRLIRLAEDLLVLARDDSEIPTRIRTFDLGEVLESAANTMSRRARERDITINVSAVQVSAVHGDPDRIRQAVENVLSNAVRFSPHGGQIVVEAGQTAGVVDIAVSDCGSGFAPEFLPVAFERFRRGDSARARPAPGGRRAPGEVGRTSGIDDDGSGLGLAIVASIMRAHRGTATAANVAGAPEGAAEAAQRACSGARVLLRWPAG
jgi:signal transduction histidine kinase